MRVSIEPLSRYIVTPCHSKHRVFIWVSPDVVPSNALTVITRDDDYIFGVLQSKIHELWSRGTGTQVRDAESGFRYTPSSTFETFPFPWQPGQEPNEEDPRVFAIAEAARQLVALRQGWLNPPEEDIGVIISTKMLKSRTLTNLYNALEYYRESVIRKGAQSALVEEQVRLCRIGTDRNS